MTPDSWLGPGRPDPLFVRPYVEVLADLIISQSTPTPLAILIDGPWGSGKTSLANMVQAEVQRDPGQWPKKHVFVWFDAWANEDAADLGAAFAASVVRAAGLARPRLSRFLSPLPAKLLPLRRQAARAAMIYGPAVVAAVLMARWSPAARVILSAVGSHQASDSGAGAVGARVFSAAFGFSVVTYFRQLVRAPGLRDVEKWIKSPAAIAGTGGTDEVAVQIATVIRQALGGRRRLIIIADNLDRCDRAKALQICDTISHLVETEGVIFLVAADSRELKQAVVERLAHSRVVHGDADAFLDKMFSLRIRVPEASGDRIWKMLEPADFALADPELTNWVRQIPVNRVRRLKLPLPLVMLAVYLAAASWSFPHFWRVWQAHHRWNAGGALVGSVVVEPLLALLSAGYLARYLIRRRRTAVRDKRWTKISQEAVAAVVASRGDANWLSTDGIVEAARSVLMQSAKRSIPPPDLLRPSTNQAVVWMSPVDASNSSGVLIDEPAVRRAALRHLSTSAKRIDELEYAIRPWMSGSPRKAKRLYNQSRLLFAVSVGRGVLGAAAQPRHVGYWAVLSDHWPGAAEVIARNISVLREMSRTSALTLEDEMREHLAEPAAGLHEEEIDEAMRFLGKLIRSGEFHGFAEAMPSLVGLLPYQRDAD